MQYNQGGLLKKTSRPFLETLTHRRLGVGPSTSISKETPDGADAAL